MEQDRNDSLAELDGVVEMDPSGNSGKPEKKKKKKHHLVRNLIILAVVAAAGFGSWRYYSSKQTSDSSTAAAVVRTYTVTKQSLATTVVANGTIASQSTTNVTCSQNYNVESINVAVGDSVEEGDIIAVLDTSELEKQIARAVESDNESLETMAKNVQNALDAKEYAWSQQPQLSDYSDDQNQTAQEKYDAAYAEWAHNFASVNGNYYDLLDEYNDALENGVEDTNLEDLRESLSECTIKATASGTITQMNLTVGSAPSGTAAVISDLNNLQVSVYVDEYDILNVKAGMTAVVTSDVVSGKEFAATVKSTSPVSSGSGYEVVVTINDPTSELLIGMDAQVTITLSSEDDVYLVPIDAVGTDDSGNSVVYMQQSDGTFSPVTVTTGDQNDYYIVISGDNVTEGMVIRASANESDATVNETSDEETDDSSENSFNFGMGGGNDMGGGQAPSGGGGGAPSGGGPGGN